MYKTKPWTLDEKALRVRKTSFFKNRESDLAIAVSRVKELFENNKNKTYSNNDIAEELNISLGTVSDITNRLEAVSDIKIVRVRQTKSALAQIFQHSEGPLPAVTKERGKRDVVLNVLERFKQNPDEVFTKDDLVKVLDNTESKIRRALQILLLNGSIKLVGSDLKGFAEYQHCKGNKRGLKIYQSKDENYTTVGKYCKENNIKTEIFKGFKAEGRLFYSAQGLVKEFLRDTLAQHADKCYNKNRTFLERMFKKS